MAKGVTVDELVARCLEDPEYRALHEKYAVASAFSVWLVVYRAEHDLSDEAGFHQLAARLGWDPDTLGDYEAGDTEPSLEVVSHVSRTLGVPVRLEIDRHGPGAPREVVTVDATVPADTPAKAA